MLIKDHTFINYNIDIQSTCLLQTTRLLQTQEYSMGNFLVSQSFQEIDPLGRLPDCQQFHISLKITTLQTIQDKVTDIPTDLCSNLLAIQSLICNLETNKDILQTDNIIFKGICVYQVVSSHVSLNISINCSCGLPNTVC